MAGSIVVGILRVLLNSDTAQFDAGMNRAANTAKTKGREINTSFAGLSKSAAGFARTFAGAFGVTLSASAIIGFTKHLVDLASNIVDVSRKTGLSVEAIQRMQFVADQTGTTIDAMTEASFRLGVRLSGGSGSVRNAAKELGIEWARLQQQSPEEQFNTIVTALGRVTDASDRNRIGVELFGKSFTGIATAVAEGYDTIANAAVISSKAQIEAIERAADRWDAFVTNVKASSIGVLGNILLMEDAMREVEAEDKKAGTRRSDGQRLVEAERRVTMGLVGARKQDIELTIQTVKAKESYAHRLAMVRAELAKLTSAQRAEITAAQQLGVSTADLEDEYGLTEGSLKLLTQSTKVHAKESVNLNAELYAQSVAAIDNQQAFDDLLKTIEKNMLATRRWAEDTDAARQEAIAFHTAAQQLEMLPTIDEILTPPAMIEGGPDTRLGKWGETAGITLGATIKANLTRSLDGISDVIVRSLTGGGGFLNGLKALGVQMADAIVKPMIDAMIKRIAAAKLGQALAGAFGMGGAGAAKTAIGAATSVGTAASGGAGAAGGGIGAGGATTTVGAGVGLGTTLAITGGIAGGALLAWAIWKKGLFRGGEESLKVSPRRDKFLAQFGGPGSGEGSGFRRLADRIFQLTKSDQLVRDLAVAQHTAQFVAAQTALVAALGKGGIRARSFMTGGFVPPGAVVPAMLHGGLHGEDVVPRGSASGGGSIIINIQASAIDAAGMDQVFAKDIIPRMKNALVFNQGGLLSTTQRTVR